VFLQNSQKGVKEVFLENFILCVIRGKHGTEKSCYFLCLSG
jgi:hypothetical protein